LSRYTYGEYGTIGGSFTTGDTVTVTVYDLSTESSVSLSIPSASEIGATGEFYWSFSNLTTAPTVFTEYLAVMTNGTVSHSFQHTIGGYPNDLASSIALISGVLDTPANFMADVSALATPANFMADVTALAGSGVLGEVKAKTDLIPLNPTSVNEYAARLATLQTDVSATATEATVSGMNVTVSGMDSFITDVHDEVMGKWVVDTAANTLTLYRIDGDTVLETFDLTGTSPSYTGRTP